MNAVTQFDDSSLEATLSHWDIGQLIRYQPAANGIENSNFFIKTECADGESPDGPLRRREFVLTLMEQQPYAGEAYIPMMYALYNRGLPVAPPLATTGGYFVEELKGKPTLLQIRLPGKHVYNPTTAQVQALARFMARMHLVCSETKVQLPAYPRHAEWLTTKVTAVRSHLPFLDEQLLLTSLEKVRSLLSREDAAALPGGMIHGDLFRDNVLFNEYGLSGVLDFHHAASGRWIYDLAVAANDWCNDASGQLDPELTTQLLRAYHQVRPLEDAELWFFPTYALYAAVVFWLSRLSAAVEAADGAPLRTKNPDEFKRIVQHLSRSSFYLDPRLLSI